MLVLHHLMRLLNQVRVLISRQFCTLTWLFVMEIKLMLIMVEKKHAQNKVVKLIDPLFIKNH